MLGFHALTIFTFFRKSIFAKSKDGDSKDGTGLGFHKCTNPSLVAQPSDRETWCVFVRACASVCVLVQAASSRSFLSVSDVKAGKISSGGATENNAFGKKASGDGNSIFNVKPQKLFVSGSKSSAQSAAQQRAGEVNDKFQNTETKSGEEGETKLHTVTQCKLYRFDRAEKAWKQAGSGQLTLNQASDKSSARLVLRQDVTKRVFLNAPVWAGTACQFENKGLRFAGINHIAGADPAVHIFLVQSKETKSLR